MIKYPYHGSVVLIKNINSSRNKSLGLESIKAQGRSHIGSAKTNDFFEVALADLRSTLEEFWGLKWAS